jgi:hypothetical protein
MRDEVDEMSAASRGYPSIARRFALLGGQCYYARGGLHDFLSSHDTAEEAIQEARRLSSLNTMDEIEWWHVWDCSTNSVAAMSESQAHGANDTWPKLDEIRHG